MLRKAFSSESVTEGHPDKLCDQVSDAILDAILEKDKDARVACEAFATTGMIVVSGEISANAYVNIERIVREVIRDIGYDRAKYGFDCDTCAVISTIKRQSPDIARGVNKKSKEGLGDYDLMGAGDQGMMYGYACNDSAEFMPLPISLAHKLTHRLSKVRKTNKLEYLRPDGKAQIVISYEDGKPKEVLSVVVSSQHSSSVKYKDIKHDILEKVIKNVIPQKLITRNTKYYINPTGKFVIGGPAGDCGLTGRKIIVDTYGGMARHGGGCFSGKDATKVDRSGAYMCRYIAKNFVAAGLTDRCEVGVYYAIGVARPLSIFIDTFGTSKVSDDHMVEIINKYFDLRPRAIISKFDLCRPMYRQLATYGHFGREDLSLPWEELDMVDILKEEL